MNIVTYENIKNIVSQIKSLISSHTSNKNNPHGITPAQIGAASTENLKSIMQDIESLKYGVDIDGGSAFTAEVSYDIDYDGGGAFD